MAFTEPNANIQAPEKRPVTPLDLSNIVAKTAKSQAVDDEKPQLQQSSISSNASIESFSNLYSRCASSIRQTVFFPTLTGRPDVACEQPWPNRQTQQLSRHARPIRDRARACQAGFPLLCRGAGESLLETQRGRQREVREGGEWRRERGRQASRQAGRQEEIEWRRKRDLRLPVEPTPASPVRVSVCAAAFSKFYSVCSYTLLRVLYYVLLRVMLCVLFRVVFYVLHAFWDVLSKSATTQNRMPSVASSNPALTAGCLCIGGALVV